jgi:hypothetical protein
MRNQLIIPALVIVTCFTAVDASARTWRVELDGSGDFTDIQPAVDASAAGDTILIGPGRYDTFRPCVAPAWTEPTIVWVTKDNLTFLGSGQGSTILGPTTYFGPPGRDPKGFCSFGEFDGTIKDLTIENIECGVHWETGSIVIENCTVRGDNNPAFIGMLLWTQGATIRNCTIDTRFAGDACAIGAGGRDIVFENCSFPGYGNGVFVTDGSQNTRFIGCQFVHSNNGVLFDQMAQGSMSDCTFEGIQANALTIWNGAHADLDRVRIDGAATGIATASGAVVTGTNVVLEGTRDEGLLACCNSFVTLTNSHFLPAQGYAVRCVSTWASATILNLTGNYWGTTDGAAISGSIWDAVDQASINCTVQFVPFADGPVPTESTSWGDLKALWR